MRLDLERDVEVLRNRINTERDATYDEVVSLERGAVNRDPHCHSLNAHRNIIFPGRPSVLFVRQLVQI